MHPMFALGATPGYLCGRGEAGKSILELAAVLKEALAKREIAA